MDFGLASIRVYPKFHEHAQNTIDYINTFLGKFLALPVLPSQCVE
jgi:hypothetical protein